MLIKCSYTDIINIDQVKKNINNENKHSEKQIEVLSKIIKKNGQRSPLVISKLSGLLVKGHARLEAIKKLGWPKVAVDYQDYKNVEEELNDRIADNEIAKHAEFNRDLF